MRKMCASWKLVDEGIKKRNWKAREKKTREGKGRTKEKGNLKMGRSPKGKGHSWRQLYRYTCSYTWVLDIYYGVANV